MANIQTERQEKTGIRTPLDKICTHTFKISVCFFTCNLSIYLLLTSEVSDLLQ